MDTSKSRTVFAHYMVGLTDGQSLDQWRKDVADAKAAGIDGFALNIGPADAWTLAQLHPAYAVAEAAGFSMFLSFDMATGEWNVQQVIDLINEFKSSPAQYNVNNLPFISTFEGPAWADNWQKVRVATGGIYLVPNWTSLGPTGVKGKLGIIDGAFSWAAWPRAGQTSITVDEDIAYQNVLGRKTYMMGISPSFYTSLPQWSKNWYFSGESLWYDRWQQALDILPDMIQIITWNDFGESSYIGEIVPEQIVQGAKSYVDGFSHTAFRAVLPYLIAAYKAGSRNIQPPTGASAIAWYRTTPASAGPDGGTIWGQTGNLSAALGARDVVSVMVISTEDTVVHIGIGYYQGSFSVRGSQSPISFFEIPFTGRTGPVWLKMNGRSALGPAITGNCAQVIFNVAAIHL